jgi:hypothetical protein
MRKVNAIAYGFWLLAASSLSFADSVGPPYACPAGGGVVRVLLDGEFQGRSSNILKNRDVKGKHIALASAEEKWIKELAGASKNSRIHLWRGQTNVIFGLCKTPKCESRLYGAYNSLTGEYGFSVFETGKEGRTLGVLSEAAREALLCGAVMDGLAR